jgi:RIO kinase 1
MSEAHRSKGKRSCDAIFRRRGRVVCALFILAVQIQLFTRFGMRRPSPRLKDAEIPAEQLRALYVSLLLIMRRMYLDCKLVHADLSEYNILYHQGSLYLIDVSQSVEHDHPHAWDFLRNDLKNVDEFWGRRGVRVLGLRRAFEFVTTEKFTTGDEGEGESVETILERWLEEGHSDDDDEGQAQGEGARREEEAAHEDKVFMQSYIPRTLNEVYDPERDVVALVSGKTLIYTDNIGIVPPNEGTQEKEPQVRFQSDTQLEDDVDNESESGSDEEGDEKDGHEDRKPRGHRHEDRDAKKVTFLHISFGAIPLIATNGHKERKKVVKAEAREKRKSKIPKAEKKRKIKATARSS